MVVCAAENRGKDQGGEKNKTRDGIEGPTVKKWFFHFIYIYFLYIFIILFLIFYYFVIPFLIALLQNKANNKEIQLIVEIRIAGWI